MKRAIAILLLLAAGCGKGGPSPDDLHSETTVGLTYLFPAVPEKFDIQIPPNIRSMVVSMENYRYQVRNFEAGVSKVTYVPTIQASADGAVEGCLSNVASSQVMTRGTTEKKPVQIGGCDGIRYAATFRKGSQDIESQGVILAKGAMMWQVFVIYLKDNANSKATATKILDSVQLTP